MELALPTPVSYPPSLERCLYNLWHTQGAKVAKVAVHPLGRRQDLVVGTPQCAGTIQAKRTS
jgi:hypothetical protein